MKIFRLLELNEGKFQKFQKSLRRLIYLQDRPNQTLGYWLISPSQQALPIEINTREQANRERQIQNSKQLQSNLVKADYNKLCD